MLDAASGSAYNPAEAQELPSWITERVRVCQRVSPQSSSAQAQQQQQPEHQPQHAEASHSDSGKPEFVLYWMRTAIRGHENPALDVAKHEAKQQGLPLLVVAFVLTTHPYPTARRFNFWLEGLRDTQRELRAQAGAIDQSMHFMLLSFLARMSDESKLAPHPKLNLVESLWFVDV